MIEALSECDFETDEHEGDADRFGPLLGRSPAMRELFAHLAVVAATEATVVIGGETGTGKELVASAIHAHSRRRGGPLEIVDCSTLPANLIESELFGHERGAFTGAAGAHAGAFERAAGGTVFLDEIGELPLDMQPKLLGVLERREVRRVGGRRAVPLDIRVVCATHRDLRAEVAAGRFRQDLYYRLAVAEVHVPALRDRREDIELLAGHFLARAGGGGLRPETLAAMKHHDWPGNVRELRNAVERAALRLVSPRLGSEPGLRCLPAVPLPEPVDAEAIHFRIDDTQPFKEAKQRLVQEFERRYLRALFDRHGKNFSAAARAAGIDRMALHKIVRRAKGGA